MQVTLITTPTAELQNGSFEFGPAQCTQTFATGSTALLGWTVVSGEVRRVGTCGWQQGYGDYSVELGSPSAKVGAIEQTFTTTPGAQYSVSFTLAGNPAVIAGIPSVKPLAITIDGIIRNYTFDTARAPAGPPTSVADMGWRRFTYVFTAVSTSSTIRFTSDMSAASVGGAAAVVDSISVESRTALLRNPSFDEGAPTSPSCFLNDIAAGSAVIPGWQVSVGSVDWVGPCIWTSNFTSSYMLDLIGSGKIGGIRQSFATVPGRQYGIYAVFAGNPSGDPIKPITVSINGVTKTYTANTTGATPTSMRWQGAILYFPTLGNTATVDVVSDMSSSSSSGAGGVVDGVFASEVAPPVTITNVTATTVSGRIDDPRYWGFAGLASIRINRYPSCSNGQFSSPVADNLLLFTDATGNFTVQPSAAVMTPGAFLWAQVFNGLITTEHNCVYLGADNEVWPRALSVDGSPTTADYLDMPGKARWYKFRVLPGQQVRVSLTGLPADYDLAVFKDIRETFSRLLVPQSTTDLIKLGAEYAPSMFSPSMFSPSVFSPAVFSPDAYAPSMFSPVLFSPSMFSPSMFSPSVVSPSMFSPSMFSPSMFSPSMFSPSMFSPSMFSPGAFSPSMFSPVEIAQAFSSAQTRSLLGVSATTGKSNEVLAVNTWNEIGEFYVRVWGRGGASSTAAPFTLTVDKGPSTCTGVTDLAISTRPATPGAGVKTVFVTDSSTVNLDEPLLSGGTLRQRLTTFLARSEIAGVLLDVAGDARVRALKAQAAGNAACPFAMNLVAREIKAMIDAYRANNSGLRYVVLAGNDGVIPFFRYPDESLLGQESSYSPPVATNSTSEASLRRDFVLGQDAYGSSQSIAQRSTDLPVPGLAVGRLVETPAEMAGLIDAYVSADGRIVPRTSLVTGYDFLADVADAVKADLELGTGRTADALIAPNTVSPQDSRSWTATDLKQALLTTRHDLIFLAGHFSANSALAADFATSLVTLDLVASPVDLTNSIVFSAGCHSGYNLVDAHAIEGLTLKLDWAQALAQKKATLVAGTGYQYGDTDFIEYSERLYQGFARQLRYGTGPVAVGEALARAKLEYLVSTPDLRGLHQKAVLEATVFGLPMLGVDFPAGRLLSPTSGPAVSPVAVASGPAATLGMKTQSIRVAPTLSPQSVPLTNVTAGPSVTAHYFSGPDGVVVNPAVPALPLAKINVTSTDPSVVLRGVGFRGGKYVDSAGIVPLTGAATADLRGVHVPFGSSTFFPMKLATANYFGALAGSGGTTLLVTPAQYRADNVLAGTSVERRFDQLDFKLYYSGIAPSPDNRSVALSDAPTIVRVDARTAFSGGPVTFIAQVVGDPAAAIYEVWLTYAPAGVAGGGASWSSIDLQQCVPDDAGRLPAACSGVADSALWTAQLVSPVDIQYIVQAASGTGLVTLDDNVGRFYRVNGGTPPATTTGSFTTAPPTSANFGATPSVSLVLKSGTAPLANQVVT
ncbi:MAG: DUF642 domain-containing protein, partial [Mycobacteriales bacterium]